MISVIAGPQSPSALHLAKVDTSGILPVMRKAKPSARVGKSSLKDTQNEPDYRKLAIDKVGVKGLRFPIDVRDKALNKTQHTVATIGLYVDLPHHYKGTHMSRFVEVLNSHGRVIHVKMIPTILREMQARLHADTAHFEMEFPYFIEKKSPVVKAKGLMDYTVRFSATGSRRNYDLVMTLMVPVTTLCPCSKAISAEGAHNQRGMVTVQIRFTKTVWIEELVGMVEASASSELYSLLKREDEKYVTEKAYGNPVFVEDLVRNVAVHLNQDKRIQWYRIEAENFESIHNHNAYACIEKKLP